MSETLVPTMSFRWNIPTVEAYSFQPGCAVLEQRMLRHGTQEVWVPVPFVETMRPTPPSKEPL